MMLCLTNVSPTLQGSALEGCFSEFTRLAVFCELAKARWL
jgi:hypothetical protein